jgi:hypothetical protein
MGYTQGHSIYAALGQTGVQKFLHNVYSARPHYFNYASAGLGGGSVDIGLLPALPIPGSSSGIDFSLQFTEPVLSFFPAPTFPKLGPPVKDQFGLAITATICLVTGMQSLSPRVRDLYRRSKRALDTPTLQCADIKVLAVGGLTTQDSGTDKLIGLWAQAVDVSGTGNLDPLIAFILHQALNSLLAKLQFSVNNIAQGAFAIRLEDGPNIDGQQLEIWAGII